jgi:predicted RNase H-like HicB family nuclease
MARFGERMKAFTAIVERDSETNLYVGYVPGFPGAHSQGETLDELHENLREVIEMLLEDEQVVFDAEFVGTQQIMIG